MTFVYIRARLTPDDPWPFPMEDGWMSAQGIDEKGQPTQVRFTVHPSSVVTATQMIERAAEILLKRGWKPPSG